MKKDTGNRSFKVAITNEALIAWTNRLCLIFSHLSKTCEEHKTLSEHAIPNYLTALRLGPEMNREVSSHRELDFVILLG